MSVEQCQILTGVFSRVMNFDWSYTDQSKMSAILIISSVTVLIPSITNEPFEPLGTEFENRRIEKISLIQRSNNLHSNHLIYMDRNEKTGEEIDFEY